MLGQFAGGGANLHLSPAKIDGRGHLRSRRDSLEGQLHGKAAAQPLLTHDDDLPTHALDEALADRQPQPRTADKVAGADLIERLENVHLLMCADANAGIGHLELQRHVPINAVQHLAAQHDTADAGELDGIAQQVVQHLTQLGHVAEHQLRHLRVGAGIHLQALAAGTGDMRRDDLLDHLQRREGGGIEHQLAGLYFRNIQYIADHLQDRGGGRLDRLQIIALALVQVRQAEQLQGAQHTIERRAYLVAHGGEKHGLGLVRPFGLLHGQLQGERALLVFGDIRERTQLYVLLLVARR